MKTTNIFKKFFFATMILGTVLAIPACDKDDDDDDNDNMYTVSSTASGSQENPPASGTGSSTLTGTYNSSNNRLDYTISWTGLTGLITAAHFHGPAATTENADPIADIIIGTNGISGSTSGTVTLADSMETHLLNGRLYYNLHTVANVTGEVRGQLVASNQ